MVRKDWTKEFAKLAEQETSPESPNTGQILDLIAERDELRKASESALNLLQYISSSVDIAATGNTKTTLNRRMKAVSDQLRKVLE